MLRRGLVLTLMLMLNTSIPLYPHTLMLLYLYTLIPLHPYTLIPLHPYTLTPLYPYDLIPLWPYTIVPLYPYTLIPLYPYTIVPLHPYIHTNTESQAKTPRTFVQRRKLKCRGPSEISFRFVSFHFVFFRPQLVSTLPIAHTIPCEINVGKHKFWNGQK